MIFPAVGTGEGVGIGVEVGTAAGVPIGVGVGVGVTWVLQPASKAIRIRSNKPYLFIVFPPLRERILRSHQGVNRFSVNLLRRELR